MWTSIHKAIAFGQNELVECFIIKRNKIDEKDENGRTPIFVASQYGKEESIKLLIQYSYLCPDKSVQDLVNESSNSGFTPLMISVQNGNINCVRLLFEFGANPLTLLSNGMTAITLAIEWTNNEILEFLLQRVSNFSFFEFECRPDLQEVNVRNPLHLAIINKEWDCFELLIKYHFPIDSIDYFPNIKFSMGMPSPKYVTPLGLAISIRHIGAIKLLLKNGANINFSHFNVYSPSHCLFSVEDTRINVEHFYSKVFKLLVKHNLNVNYCRSEAEPNELIHSMFYPKCLKLLLDSGLDTNTFFKDGFEAKFSELASYLLTDQFNIYQLLTTVKIIQRNDTVLKYFLTLEKVIVERFGINESTLSIFKQRPHSLKECTRFSLRRQIYSISSQRTIPFGDAVVNFGVNGNLLPSPLRDYLKFNDYIYD